MVVKDLKAGKNYPQIFLLLLIVTLSSITFSGCLTAGGSDDEGLVTSMEMITITDALGRTIEVPRSPDHVICSGAGCLRYLTYLEAQDKIVGVDDIEQRETRFDARPYAIANPQFKSDYPLFGEFRGNDDPEKILLLEPQPQVIFKTYPTSGYDPIELQEKTGIPVVVLNYGDMVNYRDDMYQSLRIMGGVMGKEQRVEEVIDFFEETIDDLNKRTADVLENDKVSCYVGGIAASGPHGFQSTEPTYTPFLFTNALNMAYDTQELAHVNVAKEKILEWDPEMVFVDLSTLQSEDESSALYELQHDDAYRQLSAVQSGEVYSVLPYNWYTQNYGSVLADAYFTGKLLYIDNFEDVDVEDKTIEIYTFLVGKGNPELGKDVYETMKTAFGTAPFVKLEV